MECNRTRTLIGEAQSHSTEHGGAVCKCGDIIMCPKDESRHQTTNNFERLDIEALDFANHQSTQTEVKLSEFSYLWETSTNDTEDFESGSHPWTNETESMETLPTAEYKYCSAWTTYDAMRCFTNNAFSYSTENVSVEEEERELSDESSQSSSRNSEYCFENTTNTIGRFSTGRLSHTLLKLGISESEAKDISKITDDSVKMTKHLKTRVSRDCMQGFVTGMVVIEIKKRPFVVVADQLNQCVKCFSVDTEHCDHDWLRLCNWPSSITRMRCINENLVAVNIPFPHHMDIVRVSPRLSIVHKIRMPKEYFCLASIDKNKMAASSVWEDPPTIDILSLSWKERVTVTVLRTVVVKRTFLLLCNDPFFLNSNSRGDILLVDWESNGFVCMDQYGSMKFKYVSDSTRQIMQPHSVTCDSYDSIYITDTDQNRIVQLTKRGVFVRDVLRCEHGLDEPRHVAIDSRGDMFVSQFNGDVKRFSFHPPVITKPSNLFERLISCFTK